MRLSRIQHLLHQNPHGLTSLELAELCGVGVRTVQRDLAALESDLKVPIRKEQYDRYCILEGYVLPPVSFSLYEALAVFLAARLIMRQTDENNPHIQAALAKLSTTLPAELGDRVKRTLGAMIRKRPNPAYVLVFEKAAIAWSTRRKLKLQYRSLRHTEPKGWLLDPYFIDMTGVGCSTYVIGNGVSEDRSGLTTFKLDRISDVEVLEEKFDLPRDLELDALLASAWGIVWGEETTVKLKFSPPVTRRVRESIWHLSQTIEDLPDGGCVLTVTVDSTLEMTPWILGWGPDVEVLEPEELREQMRGWARDLYAKYSGRR